MILTIDIGSSSLRTNLFTEDALQLPEFEAQKHYPVVSTPGGGVEIEPAALLASLLSAIDETLAKSGKAAGSIKGVGFCSLVSNVLGIDAAGKPTTPIYTWADTRCAPQAEELRARLDESRVHEQTGCHIHTSYLPARLLWLKDAMPEAYKRTARWITLGDYLYSQMLSHDGQSLSVASWSGLLNRTTLLWDDWLLSQIGIGSDHLPPLVDAYSALACSARRNMVSLRG